MKKPFAKFLAAACVAAGSLIVASASQADTVAYTPSGTSSTPGAVGLLGLTFQVNIPISVTQLGFYAISIGGGDTPHVTLENFSNPSAPTVLYDTGNINSNLTPNAFNYVTLAIPITLSVGVTYAVIAPAYFVPQYTNATGFTYGSVISSPQFYKDTGEGWNGWSTASVVPQTNYPAYTSFPAQFNAVGTPYTSANFQYLAAPEPGTYAMVSLALGGLFLLRRRQRQAA